MKRVRRRCTGQCRCSCIVSCFLIGFILFTIKFNSKQPQPSICVSKNPDNEVIDRQDEWQYKNSITGQWYHWRTLYTEQKNQAEWRVNWLNVAPKSYLGVIVYLATYNEIQSLKISLAQLSHLLSNNPRPVVIFHEGDFSDNNIQQSLAQTLGIRTPLAFEQIKFSNNSIRPKPVHRRFPPKYFHMCRFFTLMLPSHPLLTLFSFYWRLDTHSYIFGRKSIEDPFNIMQKRKIQYAFTMVNVDHEFHTYGLWSIFHEFLKDHCLEPSTAFRSTQTGWFDSYSLAIIFTNFAIANVSLFRDHSLIRAWLHKVDLNGGIYRHRWGDAPIHTLVLTQLIPRTQVARFRYFGYMHRNEYVCATGINGRFCEAQIKTLFTGHETSYYYRPAGCSPHDENPLCHYYPEITL
ncbi:unnamed protein product [Rotaria magnacalcarata]|uniref:Uncharacterized protein n=2 Tax=Rotaria magnacalcarata TaxID=392030 RepID=A0A819FAN0_9BILA|nr:unnamed protein product [Rotaria magnacalcarata]CAF2106867.1 unnamed protein product [Rotaria magnacalcarata]CAF2267354.1 unnamed protein product [Rotaria magnacalcarata]CAF3864748.1 unnamed protein product [Rotaria magnacalcarata]CAF4195806.1 unnamed protein product [Rotaria magnacalcarata]